MNRSVPEPAPSRAEAENVELRIPELAGRARVRKAIALVLVLAAAAAGIYYYTRPEPVVELYRTYPVARRTLVQQVDAAGRIDVQKRVEVPAPVPGRLIAIHVIEGQTVQAGQLLAELDQRAAQLAVRGAQASAQASAGGVAQARAALDAAERGLERARSLKERGLASTEDVANAESELARARASLEAAQGEQRVAAENVASARLSQSSGSIQAPIAGVVLRAPERVGAAVGPDQGPLFVIGDALTTMRVDASVSETEVALVKPGQTAEVLVTAVPGKSFRGHVQRIGIEPERGEGAVMYPVTLVVDNPDGVLRPGMTARVRMEVARVENVLSVHEAALRFAPPDAGPAPPRSRVWKRVGPRELEAVKVRTGVSDGVYTQVEAIDGSKLTEGEPLAVGLANPEDSGAPRVSLGAKK